MAPSDRPILQEPGIVMTPVPCDSKTPGTVSWYVDDLGAEFEYKGCWTGPVGPLAVGVLDATGLPPQTELSGPYAVSDGPNYGSLTALNANPRPFPHAHGDPTIVELRGLASNGVVIAVPAIAGWADLPELPEVNNGDGTASTPIWIEIVTLDRNGEVLAEVSDGG